jgi:3-mercaptopyruvate sulfurtransferase SseA
MRRFISLTTIIVLLIVALIIVMTGGESHRALAKIVEPVATQQTPNSDGVRRVTTEELRAGMEKGTVVVIDVRSEEVFKAGHIKGARWIPMDQIVSRIKELPRDKLIVTYCS